MSDVEQPELPLDSERPTALYRLYATDDLLLYVGITYNVEQRLADHECYQHWWPRVSWTAVEWHERRDAAVAAEKAAIKNEHPLHNVRGADPDTAARERRARRRARSARVNADKVAKLRADADQEERLRAVIGRVMAAGPPLTAEQRERLVLVFSSAVKDQAQEGAKAARRSAQYLAAIERARRVVADWPPLAAEQLQDVARLLWPATEPNPGVPPPRGVSNRAIRRMVDQEAEMAARIRRMVDDWPPLTPEQRDRLALLLRTGDV